MSNYGIPVPPSSTSLLENAYFDGYPKSAMSDKDNTSPLLDTKDELGMQLLLSIATKDSQDFKLLSLEEVERLKRERSLLHSRIEAHTRKLALESKVRDASQNLVKLHAQKSKRLSKQAEDQLQNASRKVDDLATDLWRLQRREHAIKEQMLEHMAGLLARNILQSEMSLRETSQMEFDERHLYVDGSALYQDMEPSDIQNSLIHVNDWHLPKMSSSPYPGDHATLEERLVETNKHVQSLLINESGKDNVITGISPLVDDIHITNLIEALKTLRSGSKMPEDRVEHVEESSPALISDLKKDIASLRLAELESSAHAADLEVQHAQAMKQLQAEYEEELDAAHTELDNLRALEISAQTTAKDFEEHKQSFSSLIATHEREMSDLRVELRTAEEVISEYQHNHNSMKENDSSNAKTIESLKSRLVELEAELVDRTRSHEDAARHTDTAISALQDSTKRLNAEIAIYRDRYELCQIELQEQKSTRALEQAASDKALQELSDKHNDAVRMGERTAHDGQQTHTRLREMHSETQSQLQFMETELSTTRKKVASCEERFAQHKMEAENTRLAMQRDLHRLETLVEDHKTELERTRSDRDHHATMVETLRIELADVSQNVRSHHIQKEHLAMELARVRNAPDPSRELAQSLQARCDLLQTELDSMLLDFEALTRTSLSYERERTRLEDRSDELLDRILDLEAQMADEKVKNLGIRTPTPDEAPSPTSSGESLTTANLRKDFRKLVQEMRSQHAKQTRMDYAEIKRLERLIAAGANQLGEHR